MADPNRPIALVDMDGTLADYMTPLVEQLRPLQSPAEQSLEDMDPDVDYFGQPHIAARAQLIKSREGFWLNLPRLPHGFAIVEHLVRAGFDIHVLTKGPRRAPIAWMEKVQWCEQAFKDYGIPHKITITEDKGLVYGKILVDDYPDYAGAWLSHRPRGRVIMPAQPWNAVFQHPQVHRYCGDDDPGRQELARLIAEVVTQVGPGN